MSEASGTATPQHSDTTSNATAAGTGQPAAENKNEAEANTCGFDTTKLKALYTTALDEPGKYNYGFQAPIPGYYTGNYSYALADTNGDKVPELLLRQDATEISNILVAGVNSDMSQLLVAEGNENEGADGNGRQDGTASAGGSRQQLLAMNNGQGIIQVSASAFKAERDLTQYRFDNGNLTAANTWVSQGDAYPAEVQEQAREITWTNTADKSVLDSLDTNCGAITGTPVQVDGADTSKHSQGNGDASAADTNQEAAASNDRHIRPGDPRLDPANATQLSLTAAKYGDYGAAIFQSPTGNIYCGISEGSAYSDSRLQCRIGSLNESKAMGTEYAAGAVKPIVAATIKAGGESSMHSVSDTPTHANVGNGRDKGYAVPYGESVTYGSFVCVSTYVGMTCADVNSGHGMFMERSTIELF